MARKIKEIRNQMSDSWFESSVPYDIQGGILFDDGWALIDVHCQDCCENVYADWEHLVDEIGVMDTDFSNVDVQPVRRRNKNHCGIRVHGKRDFFVPCYNEQNGYYSDQLDIILVDTKTGFIMKRWERVPVIDDIY